MIASPTPAGRFRIRQAIFNGTAADNGARVEFVSLVDGRCALLRDDKIVAAWGSDAYGIDVGVRHFLEVMEGVKPSARATVPPHPRPRSRAAVPTTPAPRRSNS